MKLYLAIFVFLFNLHSYVSAQSKLIHYPVETAIEGQDIRIEARMDKVDWVVSNIRVYFRTGIQKKYQYIKMEENVDQFVGNIPGANVKSSHVEYFILAMMKNEKVITNPQKNPYEKPHRITIVNLPEKNIVSVFSMEQQFNITPVSEITTLILSPDPESRMNDSDVVIALSFLVARGGIDYNSIQMFLNKKNITSQADISPLLISYHPGNLSKGKYKVKILAKDYRGNALYPVEWNFWVADPNQMNEEKIPRQIVQTIDSQNVQDRYQDAVNDFYFRRYAKTIDKLTELNKEFPGHPLASNFIYWIGESQYGLERYELALKAFKKVHSYKISEKFDDALIMSGLSYIKLGRKREANKLFKKLLKSHPDSEYASLVKKYLK